MVLGGIREWKEIAMDFEGISAFPRLCFSMGLDFAIAKSVNQGLRFRER